MKNYMTKFTCATLTLLLFLIMLPSALTVQAETDIAESGDGWAHEDMWVRLWNRIQFDYKAGEYHVFTKGLLDGAEEEMKAAGTDRESMDSFMEHNECLIIPGNCKVDETPYECYIKISLGKYTPDLSFSQILESGDKALEMHIKKGKEIFGLGDYEIREINGIEYAFWNMDDLEHCYLTVYKDAAFWIFFDIKKEDSKQEMPAFESGIMQSLSLYTDPNATEDSGLTNFSFLDGKLTISLDESAYDIFLKDNSGRQEALDHQSYSAAQMDIYMNGTGYDLLAVPAGQRFPNDCEYEFLLHIKDPSYDGVENFKDLGETMERTTADAMMSGFGGIPYELVQTDEVDYIVFDALGSTRYATIIDEHMIYFYIRAENGSITDEHREILRQIMDHVSWSF